MKAPIDIHSSGFKRYFANTSWLMGHRVLCMVVVLFVGVYVARYLGEKLYFTSTTSNSLTFGYL